MYPITRDTKLRVLLFAVFVIIPIGAQSSVHAHPQLQEARQALTGEHKDTEKAKKLLLEIVQSGEVAADPETLVWADIYLGYIDDRANDRQAAMVWYEKALAVKGASARSLDMARFGLQKPLVWIRHLDSPEAGGDIKSAIPTHKTESQPLPTRAYVTKRPPEGLTLAKNLSAKERRENFEAFWSIIDAYYGDFKLKSIDWTTVGRRYLARLDTLTGDDDFYRMMFQLVNELKDAHSWLDNYSPPILGLSDVPELQIDLFQGIPFVVTGEKAGWEVLSVDGVPPAQKMESLRPYLKACSSERAFRRDAARALLAGKAGDSVTVVLRSPSGQTEALSLKRGANFSLRQTSPDVLGINLTKGQFVNFGRYPSGLGYIRIASFMGHEELEKEFERALEALRDTEGLIIDIRDNKGGLGHAQIVGRFLRKRTLVAIDYTKNGPRHDELLKHKYYLEPSGKWQYTHPIALLVNDVTGSAADLFAAELRRRADIVTVGSTTHGNVGNPVFAVLPCGLIARISNGYVSDADDRPIEMNGNIPDIVIEPDIKDYLEGRDPVLERAKEILVSRRKAPH